MLALRPSRRSILNSSFFILHFTFLLPQAFSQGSYQLAVLKYNGGGDWYGNPTSLPNLVKYCNQQLGMSMNTDVPVVEVGSPDLFTYPLVHMTGHGNVVFSPQESENLRTYLIGGGFLHISDNYGMDEFIRPMMKRVFPELEMLELPFSHAIYHQKFNFSQGLPKIHEHDNKPPRGYGLFWEGRLVCFYDVECDLGDGWEDPDVHGDSEATRTKALQMGANIVSFAFSGQDN
ncbi:MAG: DUF4159 domain-containing protein [Flavobacteriales bacterium]|nr:DUF4159 domain-containing protein [Flavobacteriales bacterium]MBK6945671.1 DUF4159 domain-containing protein [Flavobacteriales bacterium]MBK7241775.1 DUF4159 domain-containing protein [Flavobacteriales bacterium]MBK7296218.1 DUF4159 domain-containing protein [Flavobacteriales bacterium]MBK9534777.1 DUF4159 domain-containing protein [Flavobacteriales bacterium]